LPTWAKLLKIRKKTNKQNAKSSHNKNI